MDLGPPKLVTGIVTKGRGDKKNWVTSYSISYSNDTKIWFYYKDANHLEAKVDNHSVSQHFHVSCDVPQYDLLNPKLKYLFGLTEALTKLRYYLFQMKKTI